MSSAPRTTDRIIRPSASTLTAHETITPPSTTPRWLTMSFSVRMRPKNLSRESHVLHVKAPTVQTVPLVSRRRGALFLRNEVVQWLIQWQWVAPSTTLPSLYKRNLAIHSRSWIKLKKLWAFNQRFHSWEPRLMPLNYLRLIRDPLDSHQENQFQTRSNNRRYDKPSVLQAKKPLGRTMWSPSPSSIQRFTLLEE